MHKNRRNNRRALFESLESRLHLSVTIINPTTATYTDFDGDLVTIKVSKGALTGANFTTVAGGLGDSLSVIDLSAGGFDGANISVTVQKKSTGDGLADVGLIDSTGHNLGAVWVAGDLGRILAGDNLGAAPGVRSLAVRTMGRNGLDNQPGVATLPLTSVVTGALGSFTARGDCADIFFTVDSVRAVSIGGSLSGRFVVNTDAGSIRVARDLVGTTRSDSGQFFVGHSVASIWIGGSIIGGSGTNAGYITSLGTIGSVVVRGNIFGSSGDNSGFVSANQKIGIVRIGSLIGGGGFQSGTLIGRTDIGRAVVKGDIVGGTGLQSGFFNSLNDTKSIVVRGSIIGGTGDASGLFVASGNVVKLTVAGSVVGGGGQDSGSLTALNAKSIRVGGSITGSTGLNSGHIDVAAAAGTVAIGGSLVGGSNDNTGRIRIVKIGMLLIGGDIIGGSVSGADSLSGSGEIVSDDTIGSIIIRGSILAGADNSTGTLGQSGTIWAGTTLGSLTVRGSLVGTVGNGGDVTPVYIVASGNAVQPPDSDVAIKSVFVGGRAEHAAILAGYFMLGGAPAGSNGDAQIGNVKIGGDLIASSIVAGAENAASTNLDFGDANDASIGAGNPAITSAINAITIGGQVFGTPDSFDNTDHFGFVAQNIKHVKIGGSAITLNPGISTDNIAIGATGDFNIHEI